MLYTRECTLEVQEPQTAGKDKQNLPPGKSAGECEGDPNRESMETLFGGKKVTSRWIFVVKLVFSSK